MAAYTQEKLRAIKEQHEPWLMSLPGVVGTGVGLGSGGDVRLKIFTNRISPTTREEIAAKLDGVPHQVEETGEIRAY